MKCKFAISTQIESPSSREACDGLIKAYTHGGQGPFQYSIDGGCNFQQDNTFKHLKSGCYVLVVSDGEGCREAKQIVLNPECHESSYSHPSSHHSCRSTPDADTPSVTTCSGGAPSYCPSKPHSGDLLLEIVSLNHPKCDHAGSFSLMAMGGCLPYQLCVKGPVDQTHCLDSEGCYVVSGLKPGPYCVTLIDANGDKRCHKLQMVNHVQITETTTTECTRVTRPLTVDHVHVENVGKIRGCQGSITVYASGGCDPYQYRLNNGPYSNSNTFSGLNPGNYTVHVQDATGCQASKSVVVGLVCFTRDSFVETDQGLVRVDKITDSHTIAKRPVKLVCSGALGRGSYLVKVAKDALGRNSPQSDTYFTTNHRIMYRGRLIKAGALARQNDGLKVELVRVDKPTEVFNVLLEQYGAIKVNGLEVETLHPDSELAKRYIKGACCPF